MRINDDLRTHLRKALHDAFNMEELGLLLRDIDNKRLDDISLKDTYGAIVSDVVDNAERNDWIEQLIHAACKEKPGNPQLMEVAKEFELATTAPGKGGTVEVSRQRKRIVNARNGILYGVNNDLLGLELHKEFEGHTPMALKMIEMRWDSRTDTLVRAPSRPVNELSSVLPEHDQSLLILGPPGSGKTTTLLLIAEAQIARLQTSPDSPVPVRFRLTRWGEYVRPARTGLLRLLNVLRLKILSVFSSDLRHRAYLLYMPVPAQDMVYWLARQLHVEPTYNLSSREIAEELILTGELLLLLDGLDEVKAEYRDQCVSAIDSLHDYLREQGYSTNMVVTSREDEYKPYQQRLVLGSTLRITPPTSQQVDDYLAQAGPPVLREHLHRNSMLSEMAQNPFMLQVLRTVAAKAPQTISQLEQSDPASLKVRILRAYVEAALNPTGKESAANLTEEKMLQGLITLACNMKAQGLTAFTIEDLQPSWLPTWRLRFAYTYVFDIGIALAFAYVSLSYALGNPLIPALCILGGAILGVILSLVVRTFRQRRQKELAGTTTTVKAATEAARIARYTEFIRRIEPRRWSFQKAAKGLAVGILSVIGGFGIATLVFVLIIGLTGMDNPLDPSRFMDWNAIGIPLLMGFNVAVAAFLISGFRAKAGNAPTNKDNHGRRFAAKNIVIATTFAGVIVLLNALSVDVLYGVTWEGLLIGLVYGGLFWLCAAADFGGLSLIQHYVLRWLLYSMGIIPKPYSAFLDQAGKLGLLRKIGQQYSFRHELLQEYFASLATDPKCPADDSKAAPAA